MARPRTIIGIGEAILAELPDRVEPAGLALRSALAAVRLGHRGVPVSRVGQDRLGDELLESLRALDLDASHIQSDPDLPTARTRPAARAAMAPLPDNLAFDNLQWDYDLSDLAQQTDVVIFGVVGARSGQSRSVIQRFLSECTMAVRVADLVERDGAPVRRTVAQSLLQDATLAVLDETALDVVMPGHQDREERDTMLSMLRQHGLEGALLVHTRDGATALQAHDAEDSSAATLEAGEPSMAAIVVAYAAAMVSGAATTQCLAEAQRAATTRDASTQG